MFSDRQKNGEIHERTRLMINGVGHVLQCQSLLKVTTIELWF